REFTASKSEVFMPGRISMSKFYLKRVRRILPAAFVVLIAINVYAYFNLNQLQVQQIKTDSIWVAFFAANINFMHQATDYFAQTLQVSPLQHYWSLAVEEQFYLIWPMFFLFVSNIRGRVSARTNKVSSIPRTNIFFGLAIISSIAWLIIEFGKNPTSAYFSTFGRIWELAFGGVLSLVDGSKFRAVIGNSLKTLRWGSLTLLLGSLAIVTPQNFGYTLYLPALATGFLLVSGANQESPDTLHRVLSIRVLTGIGAISYSLYLWHWPFAVFGKELGYLETLSGRMLGILIAILLSVITYYLVEQPALRIPLYESKRRQMLAALRPQVQQSPWRTGSITFVMLVLLVYATYPPVKAETSGWTPPASAGIFAPNATATSQPDSLSSGSEQSWKAKVATSLKLTKLPANLNPSLTELSAIAKTGGFGPCEGKRMDPATLSSVCESLASGPGKPLTAVILGDSHARMIWPAVLGSLDNSKWNITLLAMSGCPVPELIPNKLNSQNAKCAEHRQKTIDYIERVKPDLTILSDAVDSTPRAGEYLVSYMKVMPRITAASKYVVLVENTPLFPNLITCLDAQNTLTNCQPKVFRLDPLRKVQRQIAGRFATGYWDISQALCSPAKQGTSCPAVIGRVPTTADGAHVLEEIASSIAPFLVNVLDKQGIENLAKQE
ncbi:MAG: acyltransferase, partial [Actinomycetales bacterium]|nr:acyltransferase [Actinomycetales bacterium]